MLQALNGVSARGIGAVDARTGATIVPWRTNATFYSGGSSASVLSLSSDGTSIYGGGLQVRGRGRSRGHLQDRSRATARCSGCRTATATSTACRRARRRSTRSATRTTAATTCGWPQPSPWDFNRAIAFTEEATGTLTHDPFAGATPTTASTAAPSLLSWFPRLDVGTFTGKSQAAWTVAGNAHYVVARRRVPAGQQYRPAGSGALRGPADRARRPGTAAQRRAVQAVADRHLAPRHRPGQLPPRTGTVTTAP